VSAGKHITFASFGQAGVDVEADFVVVGSGAGGAAAAVVLARGGHRVAIVEAGPWRAPADYPFTTYGAMRDLFADWGSLVTQSRALWPVVQASCVGGTTVINSAIVVRTPGDCFARWEREYGVAGDALAKRVWSHQDRIEHELSAEVVPPDARGLLNTLAMDAAQAKAAPAAPRRGMSTRFKPTLSARAPAFTARFSRLPPPMSNAMALFPVPVLRSMARPRIWSETIPAA